MDWNTQTIHVADQELYAVIPGSSHLQIKPFNLIFPQVKAGVYHLWVEGACDHSTFQFEYNLELSVPITTQHTTIGISSFETEVQILLDKKIEVRILLNSRSTKPAGTRSSAIKISWANYWN